MSRKEKKPKIKKDNEPLSALSHFIGALLSIAALVLMIIYAALHGTAAHVVGFSIFGASLILLYAASTIYHWIPKDRHAKLILRRIDHAMIFVLIAGTYTPLCITMASAAWGWSLFGVIWGLALIGIIIKAIGIQLKNWVSPVIYICMGWLLVVAFSPLVEWLPLYAIYWLIAGGLFYTLGVIFYGLEKVLPRTRWWGMHEVFHLFVVAGSFSHFWLMLKYIVFL